MHELSICQALLDEVARFARKHGAARVLSVTVRIGPLAGVEAGLLQRAFTAARRGTVANDAQLVIERAPLILECRRCGRQTPGRLSHMRCAACDTADVRVAIGKELTLQRFELETAEEAHVQ